MTDPSGPAAPWTEAAAYERFMGRWSRICGRRFLDWLAVPRARSWADVGCGTGAFSTGLLDRDPGARLVGVDPSPAFIAHADLRLASPRASFVVGDAEHLPIEDHAVEVCMAGLVLNFVPDPAAALREMRRVTRPGGTVAVVVWDYADGMQLLRRFWDAAVALDPAAAELDEGRRFGGFAEEPLAVALGAAGLRHVETRAMTVPTRFVDFDDLWQPFMGGVGPAGAYCASLDERGRLALRDRLHASLPIEPDGGIALTCRAWAARGVA